MSVEGPVEVYLRARSDVLKSLFDGIDRINAAANYHFALRNLQRHNPVYLTKSDDVIARLFSNTILSKSQDMDAVTDLAMHAYSGRTLPAIGTISNVNLDGEVDQYGYEGLMHGSWPQLSPTHEHYPDRNSEQNPYGEHGPFSEEIHPLLQGNRFVDVLRDYYLRPDPNTPSLAEKEAKMEISHQKYWGDSGAFDNNFLGKLQGGDSAHDYYEVDFLRWLKNQNIGPAELDDEMKHNLRAEHFNQRSEQWTDGEEYIDENGMPHSRKLGWLGYNLGLEFIPPEKRTEVLGHLFEHGSDRKEAIKPMAAARLKRNFISRTAGEKLWFTRGEKFSGPHIEPIHEKPHKESSDIDMRHYTQIAQNIDTGDAVSIYDRLLTHHRDMEKLPNKEMPLYKNGQFMPNPKGELTSDTLNMLAGLDEEGNLYPEGKHPIYGDKWKGEHVIEPETLSKFRKQLEKEGGIRFLQKNIRNAYLSYRNMIGPNPDFVSKDEKLNFYHDADGHTRTLASHWMEPFHKRGGLARDEETYIDMLHDFTTVSHKELPPESDGASYETKSLFGHGFHDPHESDPTKIGPKRSTVDIQNTSFIDPEMEGQYPAEALSPKKVRHRQPMIGLSGEMAGLIANLHPSDVPEKYKVDLPRKPRDDKEAIKYGVPIWNPLYQDLGIQMGVKDKTSGKLKTKKQTVFPTTILEPHEILDSGTASHAVVDENHNTKYLPETRNHSARNTLVTSHANLLQSYLDDEMESTQPLLQRLDRYGKMYDANLWHKRPVIGGLEGTLEEGKPNPAFEMDRIMDKHANSFVLATSLGRVHPPGDPSPHGVLTNDDFMEGQKGGPRRINHAKVGEKTHATDDPRLHLELQGRAVDKETGIVKPHIGVVQRHHDAHDKTIETHMDAITNYAMEMKQKALEQNPNLFPKDDPQTSLSNALQLFRDSNLALMRVPHELHGQMGWSVPNPTTEFEVADAAEEPLGNLAHNLSQHKTTLTSGMGVQDIAKTLGLDYEDVHQRAIAEKMKNTMKKKPDMQVMSVADAIQNGLLEGGEHVQGMENIGDDLYSTLNYGKKQQQSELGQKVEKLHSIASRVKNLFRSGASKHGLEIVRAPTRDYKHRKTEKQGSKGYKSKQSKLNNISLYDGFIMFSPEEGAAKPWLRRSAKREYGPTPIDLPKPGGHSIHDLFDGPRLNWGWGMTPTHRFNVDKKGDLNLNTTKGGISPLVSVPAPYLYRVFPELQGILTGDEHLSTPNAMRLNKIGISVRDISSSESQGIDLLRSNEIDTLGLLDDVFSKGARPDPILPMHRIFNLKDLNSLRGFSGEWVVTSWPKGERIMLTRKGDLFTARNTLNQKVIVPPQVEKDAKKASQKDFVLDGVLHKNRFYAIDVLEVEEDDVHDLKANERTRLIRATFEPHEHFQPPSPSNLRITDDTGLENTIADLEQPLLLRDATSTYMKGELRHPKWIILQKGKKVDLIVLDRSGTGPYTYRLGAGPIFDTEGLGPRAVKAKKNTYMDVGTVFRSPRRFDVGQTVSVSVVSVKEKKQKTRSLFTIRGGKIRGEGDAPASIETLGILAKSDYLWCPTTVYVEENSLRIEIPHLENDVLYKMVPNELGIELQNPQASLPDNEDSQYIIRLCEAVRDTWEPIAAALLKSKKIAAKISEKERKKLFAPLKVEEDPDPDEPFIEPRVVPGTFHKPTEEELTIKAATLAAKLMDRITKERMTSVGIEGLAFNHATPDSSPRGPTTIDGGATMPDWDPGSSEYTEEKESEEEKERERKKRAAVLNR